MPLRNDQLKLMKHTHRHTNPPLLSEITLSVCVFANTIHVIPYNYYTNLINGLAIMMDAVKTVHGAEFGIAFPTMRVISGGAAFDSYRKSCL